MDGWLCKLRPSGRRRGAPPRHHAGTAARSQRRSAAQEIAVVISRFPSACAVSALEPPGESVDGTSSTGDGHQAPAAESKASSSSSTKFVAIGHEPQLTVAAARRRQALSSALAEARRAASQSRSSDLTRAGMPPDLDRKAKPKLWRTHQSTTRMTSSRRQACAPTGLPGERAAQSPGAQPPQAGRARPPASHQRAQRPRNSAFPERCERGRGRPDNP